MKNLLAMVIVLGMIAFSCAAPPDVTQGVVARCDDAAKIVFIQDPDKPGGTIEFHFEDAEVGAAPQPGDTVRIAYRKQNDVLKATRIMNISRQKDLKSGN